MASRIESILADPKVKRDLGPAVPKKADRPRQAKLYFYYASMNAANRPTCCRRNSTTVSAAWRRCCGPPRWTAGAGTAPSKAASASMPRPIASIRNRLVSSVSAAHADQPLSCVLVDEAQFLTKAQVWQLARIADEAGIPCCAMACARFPGRTVRWSRCASRHRGLAGRTQSRLPLRRKATMNLRV